MGRKGNWLSSVKKAFSPESKQKKSQKLKQKPLGDERSVVPDPSLVLPCPLPVPEELHLTEVEDKEISNADTEVVAIATDDEAVVEAPPEMVINPVVNQYGGKTKHDVAAIKIQTAVRGHQARRALRALRGLMRLKSLVEGPPVKRQTTTALKCMQTLARVQTQIQSRRIRMSEENKSLQRQLLQNRAKELASLKVEEVWDDSPQSKEQMEANLLHKYEAAMRREKAMAYSFTHQQTWKKSAKPMSLMFMDLNNPQWGWSWLERWTGARPWDTKTTSEKGGHDTSSPKSAMALNPAGGEIIKAYARHQPNSDNPSPPMVTTRLLRKSKLPSPKETMPGLKVDDPRSPSSLKSEMGRRHSIPGPLMRDDESLASSLPVPSYMAPTKSAKAKVRLLSSLGVENVTPEKDAAGSMKKRLSFPGSPARPPRRHSGPPKVDLSSDQGGDEL